MFPQSLPDQGESTFLVRSTDDLSAYLVSDDTWDDQWMYLTLCYAFFEHLTPDGQIPETGDVYRISWHVKRDANGAAAAIWPDDIERFGRRTYPTIPT